VGRQDDGATVPEPGGRRGDGTGLALDAGRPYVVCSKWLSPGPTQVGTTPELMFQAAIKASGDVKLGVKL
jgi:hypothetical protein